MGTATVLHEALRINGVAGIVAEIRAEIGACRLCRGLRPHKKQPPGTFGTTRTGYLLVGEAPTYSPRPFDDAAGDVLRRALSEVGDEEYRELEDLFFLTHAVRCVPRHPKNTRKIKKTRPPTRAECRACRPYLQFELRALHPKLIIAVGSRAADAVLGRSIRIGEAHGQRHRVGDAEVLTLLTPSPNNRAPLKRLDMTIENYSRWLTGLFGALIDELRR
ncbi:MAG: uracil-DNA glycosylase [Planctomycetota bacterium]|jgi:DNA polymerase